MRIPFAKLHGLGNDFILSAAREWREKNRKVDNLLCGKRYGDKFLAHLAKVICERHAGIGADGFLIVEPPRQQQNHARARFFNADGSEAEMSGNGIRCVGAFLMQSRNDESPLRIETLAGVKVLDVVQGGMGKWMFRVAMGGPILEPEKIPFSAKRVRAPVVGYRLATKHGNYRVTVTSMGNPHCSLFVKNFGKIDWPAVGHEIETHPFFPNRTNVEFVRVISRREIEVRYWERGVGTTSSSGTGSCGAVVASILNGFTDRRVRVQTLAGKLDIEWRENREVILTGPAQWIAEGVFFCGGAN